MQALSQIPHNIETLRIKMNERAYFSMPHVGDYKFSARTDDYNGWLKCDGRELNAADYPYLFEIIGTSFGYGEGEGTFLLPNCQGRVAAAIGQVLGGASHAMGHEVGAETHTLTIDEMPTHNHAITDPGHIHGGDTYSAGVQSTDNAFGTEQAADNNTVDGNTASATTGITINNRGGSQPHNNMQPTIFIGNMFIFGGVHE